jgi:hypothetical protein
MFRDVPEKLASSLLDIDFSARFHAPPGIDKQTILRPAAW